MVFETNFDLKDPVFKEADQKVKRAQAAGNLKTANELLQLMAANKENYFIYGTDMSSKAKDLQKTGVVVDLVTFCKPINMHAALPLTRKQSCKPHFQCRDDPTVAERWHQEHL